MKGRGNAKGKSVKRIREEEREWIYLRDQREGSCKDYGSKILGGVEKWQKEKGHRE